MQEDSDAPANNLKVICRSDSLVFDQEKREPEQCVTPFIAVPALTNSFLNSISSWLIRFSKWDVLAVEHCIAPGIHANLEVFLVRCWVRGTNIVSVFVAPSMGADVDYTTLVTFPEPQGVSGCNHCALECLGTRTDTVSAATVD